MGAEQAQHYEEADRLLPICPLPPLLQIQGLHRAPLPAQPLLSRLDKHFLAHFLELAALGDDHTIVIVEDEIAGRIVAMGSVFVERKFLRGCAKVGHIEDVVVDVAARGRRLGQRSVRHLLEHPWAVGCCYKVILDYTAELRVFYEKYGFEEKNVLMAVYLHDF